MLIECGDQIGFEEGADAKVLLPETHRAVTPPPPPVEPPAATFMRDPWPPHRWQEGMPLCLAAPEPGALPGSAERRAALLQPTAPAASGPRDVPAARIGPCQGTWDSTRGAGSVPTDASSWRDCGVQHHPGDVHLPRGLCTPPSMPAIPPG